MSHKEDGLPKWMFIETLEKLEECPVCGKEFNRVQQDWGWKYGSKLVCSYHCMRKLEREDPASYEYKKLNGDTKTNKQPEPLTDVQISVIRRMYALGATYESIGKAIHRPTGSIASVVRRLGLQQRGNTGLPQEKVNKIIRMWQDGKSGYQIAQQMHTATSTVYKYVEGIQRGRGGQTE